MSDHFQLRRRSTDHAPTAEPAIGTLRERDGRTERWTGSCWSPAGSPDPMTATIALGDELPPEQPIAASDYARAIQPTLDRLARRQAAAHQLRDLLSPVLAFIDRDTDIRRSPAAAQAADALRDLLLADMDDAGRVS